MSTLRLGGRTFTVDQEAIPYRLLHRPDSDWCHVDAHGHEHYWTFDGARQAYHPSLKSALPTLTWVKDGEEWWEDSDEPHEVGHYECAICGEHVTPGYTSDMHDWYIAGLRSYYIDDESVSEETFKAEARKEAAAHGIDLGEF